MQKLEYKALDYEHGALTSRYQTHVACNCPNNSVFSICFDTAQNSLREARVVSFDANDAANTDMPTIFFIPNSV